MRILFAGGGTGGHLYPGLAIARALVSLEPGATPYFIGAKRGVERDILPQTIFPHLLLDLHPLYRLQPWRNWKTAWGLAGAWRALDRLASRVVRPGWLFCSWSTMGMRRRLANASAAPAA